MPNAAPGAATILDYSEMRRPSINNSCNKVIVIKLDKLYYSKPKLYYDKPKLFNNNMPRGNVPRAGGRALLFKGPRPPREMDS